ncbi:hypothetical protein [Cupriavidus necator]|uniref:hypothetical protein n=1 Tax=Cupriavidus necator TaxID=106590 RepID=UPI0013DF427B|nr:hypothetical protein [Cupriavidus necator]
MHASLSDAIDDGVAQRSARLSSSVGRMAARASSADCVKHAVRVPGSASRA